jgi:hypothetical protein
MFLVKDKWFACMEKIWQWIYVFLNLQSLENSTYLRDLLGIFLVDLQLASRGRIQLASCFVRLETVSFPL